MNWFTAFQLAFTIAGAILAANTQILAGQPVQLPGIKTYLEGKHIEIDVAVNPIP